MEISSRPFYGVYVSQFMRFARMCFYVSDFITAETNLTAMLLKQG